MQELEKAINYFNELIWTYPMILLLVATHLYLTFKLKFIQKYIFKAMKLSVKKDNSAGMVSNFGALAVSLAATIGTGSILGMTTAVAIGGPGAVFWMILIGIFGIATKYSECLLAVKYRVRLKETKEYVGGPMYIMKNALKMKWMGVIFAICGLLMAISGGGFLQVNAIVDVLGDAYSINGLLVGVIVSLLVAIVIIGGVKSIAAVCEWLVPIMGGLYLIAALYIFIVNIQEMPATIALIIKSAFGFKAVGGGFSGAALLTALHVGTSRSVLSTEAGMGSASVFQSSSKIKCLPPAFSGDSKDCISKRQIFHIFDFPVIDSRPGSGIITHLKDNIAGLQFSCHIFINAIGDLDFIASVRNLI